MTPQTSKSASLTLQSPPGHPGHDLIYLVLDLSSHLFKHIFITNIQNKDNKAVISIGG